MMMQEPTLYMLLLGCKPVGRNIEQHDIFFGIANGVNNLSQDIIYSWPEANGKIHVDAWREVRQVGDFTIRAVPVSTRQENTETAGLKLFFINLGGYKKDKFEEFHYKLLLVAANKSEAIGKAKSDSFYLHTGFKGAPSHLDDKYGIDVDDSYEISDLLPGEIKKQYALIISRRVADQPDQVHLGYMKPGKL